MITMRRMVLGAAFATSSTAIVAKMLAERLELNTPHRRRIIAIRHWLTNCDLV